jgi:hypothetical protein
MPGILIIIIIITKFVAIAAATVKVNETGGNGKKVLNEFFILKSLIIFFLIKITPFCM